MSAPETNQPDLLPDVGPEIEELVGKVAEPKREVKTKPERIHVGWLGADTAFCGKKVGCLGHKFTGPSPEHCTECLRISALIRGRP